MTYTVKEIFRTLQGEGAQSGRPAVFLRFSGCNLWSGREEDRATADCTFCDPDFVGVGPDGGMFETPGALAAAAARAWGQSRARTSIVITRGEPRIPPDAPILDPLNAEGFENAF